MIPRTGNLTEGWSSLWIRGSLYLTLDYSLGRGKFNVDSPSFTPSTPPKNLMSPKAADAAPFTPKGSSLHNGSTSLFSPHAGTATPPLQPNFNETASRLGISMSSPMHYDLISLAQQLRPTAFGGPTERIWPESTA